MIIKSNKKKIFIFLISILILSNFGYSDDNSNIAPDKRDISIGIGAEPVYDTGLTPDGNITIGKDSSSLVGGGRQENMFNFMKDGKNQPGSVMIGSSTFGRTGSVMIGSHRYKGEMGDVDVDTTVKGGDRYGSGYGYSIYATTVGTNSFTNGMLATNTGSFSIITGKNDGNLGFWGAGDAVQNFGATITGSLNAIESKTSDSSYSGIANSIVGVANRTFNSNGSLIFGSGNEITNSIENVNAPSGGSFDSAKDMSEKLREILKKSSGGSTLAIGGGNKADYTKNTSIIGVNNSVIGTKDKISELNYVSGYNNNLVNSSKSIVTGTNFSLENTKGNIVLGFSDKENKVINNNIVAIGNNSNVKFDGGVALGESSVSNRDKGMLGYNPVTDSPITMTEIVKMSNKEDEYKQLNEENITLNKELTNLKDDVEEKQKEYDKLDFWGRYSSEGTNLKKKIAEEKKQISNIESKQNDINASINKMTSTFYSSSAAVSVGDEDKGITRQITGVAAGTFDTDAVNVAQLKSLKSYFESKKSESNVGIALALAAANMPQISTKEHIITAGLGFYKGEQALAVGINGITRNRSLSYKASATLNTKGNVGFGLGLGYQFGRDIDKEKDYKIKELENKNSELEEKVEYLMKKMNELIKK